MDNLYYYIQDTFYGEIDERYHIYYLYFTIIWTIIYFGSIYYYVFRKNINYSIWIYIILYIVITFQIRVLFSLPSIEGYRHGYNRFDIASEGWYWGTGYRDCSFKNRGDFNDLETRRNNYAARITELNARLNNLNNLLNQKIP